ncbi:MAG: hypothetical protein WEA56_12040 [Balneolaceae bacterium]
MLLFSLNVLLITLTVTLQLLEMKLPWQMESGNSAEGGKRELQKNGTVGMNHKKSSAGQLSF